MEELNLTGTELFVIYRISTGRVVEMGVGIFETETISVNCLAAPAGTYIVGRRWLYNTDIFSQKLL